MDGRGVFWIGQDGNTYVKDQLNDWQVKNYGRPSDTNQNWVDYRNYLTQIDDPNVPQGQAQQAPGGGGGGGQALPDNTQAIANTRATLAELAGIRDRGLTENQAEYDRAMALAASQEAARRGEFDRGVVSNTQNYDRNLMASVGAGSKGLSGLMAILGGAARGTAGDWARDTVGDQTSRDIRLGADTYDENQGALTTALNTNIDALNERRRENENTFRGNQSAINRDYATQNQDLYSRMAELYSQSGNAGQSNAMLAEAGRFTPQIAANTVTQKASYNTTPSAVTAPSLSAFSGSNQPDVTVSPDRAIGSGIFTIGDTRRRLAGQEA